MSGDAAAEAQRAEDELSAQLAANFNLSDFSHLNLEEVVAQVDQINLRQLVLRGVTCYFAGECERDHLAVLTKLGGETTPELGKATHLVCGEGDLAVYEDASKMGLYIVWQAWINECDAQSSWVDEEAYTVHEGPRAPPPDGAPSVAEVTRWVEEGFVLGDRVRQNTHGQRRGVVVEVKPGKDDELGKVKVQWNNGSTPSVVFQHTLRLEGVALPVLADEFTGPFGPNSTLFKQRKGVVCLLRPTTTEEANGWKLLLDADWMKPLERLCDEFSVWRCECPHQYMEVTYNGKVYDVWRSAHEDLVASIGPDARANAAGSESHKARLEHIPKLQELAQTYNLAGATNFLRKNLPPHRYYKDFRAAFWDDGDTLRVADRWMRYSDGYFYRDVEGKRARCTFGKKGSMSAVLGPKYTKEHGQEVRDESREQGAHAREVWRKLEAAKDENIVEDDNGYTLTIFNQNGSQRMQISGERLCYNKDLMKGGAVYNFIAAFKLSLFGEEPTTTQMAAQRSQLGEKPNSMLFNGYGWKLEVNGEIYEKN